MPTAARHSLSEGLTEAKREQILGGARIVFMRDGFDATSMEQVAREANVSKGTLYNYFEGKEALFGALIEDECTAMRQNVFSLETATQKPEIVLTKLGINFMTSVLQPYQMDMYRIILAQSHKFPKLGKLFEASGPEPGTKALGLYLRQLCDKNILVIEDELRASEQFIALCEAGMHRRAHLRVEHPTSQKIKQAVASAVRVFLRAYAAEHSLRPKPKRNLSSQRIT